MSSLVKWFCAEFGRWYRGHRRKIILTGLRGLIVSPLNIILMVKNGIFYFYNKYLFFFVVLSVTAGVFPLAFTFGFCGYLNVTFVLISEICEFRVVRSIFTTSENLHRFFFFLFTFFMLFRLEYTRVWIVGLECIYGIYRRYLI